MKVEAHIGRIKVIEINILNMMENICICPHCGEEVKYGEMCMISGIHGCPKCSKELYDTINYDKKKRYEVYVRKANKHEYEPYKYVEEEINNG